MKLQVFYFSNMFESFIKFIKYAKINNAMCTTMSPLELSSTLTENSPRLTTATGDQEGVQKNVQKNVQKDLIHRCPIDFVLHN